MKEANGVAGATLKGHAPLLGYGSGYGAPYVPKGEGGRPSVVSGDTINFSVSRSILCNIHVILISN